MLHTVNKSPFEKDSLQSCLRLSNPGSKILMMEDGVYGALKKAEISLKIIEKLKECKIYVLGPDILARGLDNEILIDGIEVVDYSGFVELAVESDKVQSWM